MVTISDKQKILIFILFVMIFLSVSFIWYKAAGDNDAPIVVHNRQTAENGNYGEENLRNDDRDIVSAPVALEQIVVHVKGAVVSPGVYTLEKGKRVIDAVEIAGGALPEANLDLTNLAAVLRDAEEVVIYTSVEEQRTWQQTTQVLRADAGSSQTGQQKVNINTANKEQLQTLSGIGPSKAEAIIKHRDKYGAFPNVDALLNVNGIGQKTLDNFKDDIVAE